MNTRTSIRALLLCALAMLAAPLAAAQDAPPTPPAAPDPTPPAKPDPAPPLGPDPEAVRAAQERPRPPTVGAWRAWLDSPGGELPFGLTLSRDGSDEGTGWHGMITNGAEQIVVPVTSYDGQSLVLDIDNYAARVTAAVAADGQTLVGVWTCDRGPRGVSRLPFHAVFGAAPRFPALAGKPDEIAGRWAVSFAGDSQPAVGVFQRATDGALAGTILSTTGDYRYLAGDSRAGRLLLSAFDGAHAYLFDARLQEDGTLAGEFWSGDKGHDTFTAKRDDKAALPDAFAQARAAPGANVNALTFPDLDGQPRTLGDPAFAGKARVIEIFGSWCPNCHDEAVDLLALQKRYAGRGLSVVGLAFERSDDPARATTMVRKYAQRHGVTWPLLLAGVADKDKAAAALPVIEDFAAFPTTLFVHADGTIRAVYTGYSGPATGTAHDALLLQFTALIDELLAEKPK